MLVFSSSDSATAPSVQACVGGKTAPSRIRIRFGSHELDPRAGELHVGNLKIVLQGQPHNILLMLIEHRGEIVTRDEIQKRLWPDVVVDFEHSINQAIRSLRRVLHDSADDPKYIETVCRRGYRLKVPVEMVEEPFDTVGPNADTGPDDRRLQLITGRGVSATEDLQVIAATLVKLLHILTDFDPQPLNGSRRGRCWLNTRFDPSGRQLLSAGASHPRGRCGSEELFSR